MWQGEPRQIIALRRQTLRYVSLFLRVPTLQGVAEPLWSFGRSAEQAHARAADLLARLNIPERLWGLSPTTFFGGQQLRGNIAPGFAHGYPALLRDGPTARLDAANREVVLGLIMEATARR